ncbi:MAG TPA: transporter substrate-binding domain-containing protein [Candidatus Binatia bacterium]|nr:transporter substrate-binding domain-containing protein [Candidatus Binatia bacterium]
MTARRLCALLLLLVAACTRPPLRVASSGDYPPFSLHAADGTWSGFDVEVARAYAEQAGRPLELVPFSWPELTAVVGRGDVDVAMSGVTVRPERLLVGTMTGAVARAQAILLVPADVSAPPRIVAVNRGGHLERVARARLPDVELRLVEDNRTLLAQLRERTVDGIVTDTIEAAPLLADPAYRTAAVLSDDRKAYWVSPQSAPLARPLDDWLIARETDGTLAAWRTRWLGSAAGPTLPPAVERVVDLMARRLMLMPMVAAAKRVAGRPIEDLAREADVERRAAVLAHEAGLQVDTYVALARAQIAAAKAVQATTPPGMAPTATLEQLRVAIGAIDDALPWALRRSGVVTTPPPALKAALARDAAVPGVDEAVVASLIRALVAVR